MLEYNALIATMKAVECLNAHAGLPANFELAGFRQQLQDQVAYMSTLDKQIAAERGGCMGDESPTTPGQVAIDGSLPGTENKSQDGIGLGATGTDGVLVQS